MAASTTLPVAVVQMLQDRNFGHISQHLEEHMMDHEANENTWIILVLGHILNHEREYARFAIKRAPEEIKAGEGFQKAAQVTKLFWNREYTTVWLLLSNGAWPEAVAPIVMAVQEALQRHVAELINKSYRTVSVATACSLMGLTDEQLIPVCESFKWTRQGNGGMLSISAEDSATQSDMDLELLAKITQHMIALTS